jgi:HSP20 family protein
MTTTIERRPDGLFLTRLADLFDLPDVTRFFDRSKFGDLIRIEETVADDELEIRAEMPGIDPDKDVDITVADGLLTISAERRAEETSEKDGRSFSEFRYGSFVRSVTVPKNTVADDIKAAYKDGILTITVPRPKDVPPTVTKVAITR